MLARRVASAAAISASRGLSSGTAPGADAGAAAAAVRAPRKRLAPFHLAVPTHSLAASRAFYGGTLSLEEGRSSTTWIDYNLMGHQLVCHWAGDAYRATDHFNAVDADMVRRGGCAEPPLCPQRCLSRRCRHAPRRCPCRTLACASRCPRSTSSRASCRRPRSRSSWSRTCASRAPRASNGRCFSR